MIITFVGHGTLHIDANLSDKIVAAIKENIKGNEITTFYCGGYGDFDNHCASICRKLKSQINCEVIFVTPYITPSQQEKMKYLIDAKLYDSTVYPPIENALPRYAITKRNEWMISEADIVIAYVSHTYGGAYKTLQYARRKKKNIINLAE
ncbi:MAG: hypothetical protein IJW79_02370 [Clostridia bacterium]|nr:hypothetical protein [Clostridia bacterium]